MGPSNLPLSENGVNGWLARALNAIAAEIEAGRFNRALFIVLVDYFRLHYHRLPLSNWSKL